MLGKFGIIPGSKDFSRAPTLKNMCERTILFRSLSVPEDYKLSSYGPTNKDPFNCVPLHIRLHLLSSRSDFLWQLNEIHPYNSILRRGTIESLCFMRSLVSIEKKNAREKTVSPSPIRRQNTLYLFRWDFRLWELSMCEFYHTLGILCDSSSIPSSIVSWFHKMQVMDKNFFALNAREGMSEGAQGALREVDKVELLVKHVTSKLIKLLQKEMPTIFASEKGPGPKITDATPKVIFEIISEYWKEKLAAIDNEKKVQHNHQEKPTERNKVSFVPYSALAEWITIRYVRSLCGDEELAHKYLPILRAQESQEPTKVGIEGLSDLLREESKNRSDIEEEEDEWFKRVALIIPCENLDDPLAVLVDEEVEGRLLLWYEEVFTRKVIEKEEKEEVAVEVVEEKEEVAVEVVEEQMEEIVEEEPASITSESIEEEEVVEPEEVHCVAPSLGILEDLSFLDFFITERLSTIWEKIHDCTDSVVPIDFEDLNDLTKGSKWSDNALWDLSILKELLGADGKEEKRKAFIENFIKAIPENYKTTDIDEGRAVFEKILNQVAGEGRYSDYHTDVSTIAFAFSANALYCRDGDNPNTNLLKLLLESQNPDNEPGSTADHAVNFTTKALYKATLFMRGFEETYEGAKGTLNPMSDSTVISYEFFDKAMEYAVSHLDCSKEELAERSLKYVRAMGVKGGYRPPSEEENALDSNMKRAFYLLEKMAHENGSDNVRIRDVINMGLFGSQYTEFRDVEPYIDFFQRAFDPNYIDAGDRRSTKLGNSWTSTDVLNHIVQIFYGDKTDLDLYTEFFSLSRGCRQIPMFGEESVSVEETEEMNIKKFMENFINKYFSSVEPFVVQSKFTSCVAEAAAYTTLELPFTARRYRQFLSHVCGSVIGYGVFVVKYWMEVDLLTDEELFAYPIPKSYIHLLVEITDASCGAVAGETFDRVWESFGPNAPVDLSSAAEWYAVYRTERLPPLPYDRWEAVASLIPYSASKEHREARYPVIETIHARSVALTIEAQGNDDGCEDRYFVVQAVIDTLVEMYDLNLLSEALQHATAQCRRDDYACASSTEPAEFIRQWIKEHVISYVNKLCGRPDLETEEVHWSEVRFVLQYVHHFLEAFFLSEEVCKEVKGMINADVGPLGRPRGVSNIMKLNTPQYCTYIDVEHVEVVEKAENLLWGPDGELESVSQKLLELANPSLMAENKPQAITRNTSEYVDAEKVAHVIASRLVEYHVLVFQKALDAYKIALEEKLTANYEGVLLSGKGMKEAAREMAHLASYWERLRFLLPHKHTDKQRERRKRLYEMTDTKGKGYLHVPDLQYGISSVLHLYEFREDCVPVLFRAFFAMKEQAFLRRDIVYLTAGCEQLITPPEYCGYLAYFFQYMELYFMYDVLTSAGRVMNDLHVKFDSPVTGECLDVLPGMERVDSTNRQYTPTSALRAAAENPYQLTMEASMTSKVVNVNQFRLAKYLLRHWGFRVSNPEKVFKEINRRCGEVGELHFTDFAIWASERKLHPEGYGLRVDDKCDELATLEENLLLEHCTPLREAQAPTKEGASEFIVTDL